MDYIKKLMIGTDTLGIYLVRIFSKGVLHKKRCGMSTCVLSVDQDGNLYTCSVSNGNDYFKVGNIKDGINIERAEKFRNIDIDSNKYCLECWAANICSGECLVTSYLTHKNIYHVNQDLCIFRKGLIELAIAFANKLQVNDLEYYKQIVEIVRQRRFFEQVTDSGIWAIEQYIKLHELNIRYTDVLHQISNGNYGTRPNEILKVLSKFLNNVYAYEIVNLKMVREIRYPAIAYLNKVNNGYYNYLLILSMIENNFIIQDPTGKQNIVPIENFVEDISNIFIF